LEEAKGNKWTIQNSEGGELNEEDKKMIEEKVSKSYQFMEEECIFCHKMSTGFGSNLEHMTKEHGLFIPDIKYLVDIKGLIYYLGKRLSITNMCLWCEKHFHCLEGVQGHMESKSHSKLKDFDDDDEYDDFYDFSSSYKPSEDIESVEQQAKDNISVSEDGMSITFKNSNKKVAHRDMVKYHKQRLRRADERDSVLINKMISNYRMIGWKTATEVQRDNYQKKSHLNIKQKWFMQLGVKHNRLQKHFKDDNELVIETNNIIDEINDEINKESNATENKDSSTKVFL